MSSLRICLFVLTVFGLPAAMLPQLPQSPAPPASVQIESVSLQSVQSDRMELLVRLGLYPERSLNIHALTFANMRVNGMPVYVDPVDGEFNLKKQQYLSLPDLQITVYFRDVLSSEPVRQIVDQQKIVISGEIDAHMKANPFEQIAMHSFRPRIVLPFTKEIPVSIPGGEIGRKAALALLDLTSQAGPAASKLLGVAFPGQDAAWRRQVEREQVQHLLLIRTSYTLVTDQTTYPLQFEQLGFWISPAAAIVPAEAVKPWEFDPAAQAQLSTKRAHVDKDSVTITAEPLILDPGPTAAPWSMNQGDFRIVAEGKPDKEHVAFGAKVTSVEVRTRASSGNYAILRFRDGVNGSPVQMAAAGGKTWDRLAMIRLLHTSSAQNDPVGIEVVMLPATGQGSQIRFGEHIDDSGYGSPVLTQDGVIGLLQDEDSATMLSSIKAAEAQFK